MGGGYLYENCATCDSTLTCAACDNGFYHNQECVNNCPIGFYGVNTFSDY